MLSTHNILLEVDVFCKTFAAYTSDYSSRGKLRSLYFLLWLSKRVCNPLLLHAVSTISSIHCTHDVFASVSIIQDSSSTSWSVVVSFGFLQQNASYQRQSTGYEPARRSPSADQLMSSLAISSYLLVIMHGIWWFALTTPVPYHAHYISSQQFH